MMETHQLTNEVYDRFSRVHETTNALRFCGMTGCSNMVAGSLYCEPCLDFLALEPYDLYTVLEDSPSLAKLLGLAGGVMLAVVSGWVLIFLGLRWLFR